MTQRLPRSSSAHWASVAAMLLGGVLLIVGSLSLFAPTPAPLSVAVLLLAAIEIACGYFTLHRQRIAWSFLISTNASVALVALFATPRLGTLVGVPFAIAILPAIFLAVVAGLAATTTEFSASSTPPDDW